jgi:hypothetical protein
MMLLEAKIGSSSLLSTASDNMEECWFSLHICSLVWLLNHVFHVPQNLIWSLLFEASDDSRHLVDGRLM